MTDKVEVTHTDMNAVPTGVGADKVVPFQIDALDTRGRAVLLGDALDEILTQHEYPQAVSRLLGEMIVLTVLLGTSLKFEGKFIIQTQTNGPVSLLVVDLSTPRSIRGYARFDANGVQEAIDAGNDEPEALLGKGVLALTVDQGKYMNRYQGIVQLDGSSLEEVARSYFKQSEQIPTELRLAVGTLAQRGEDGSVRTVWRGGGVISQFLPDAPERMRQSDLHPGEAPEGVEIQQVDDDDAWAETKILMETIEDAELIDENVGVHTLLYRLFHERGVRVYDPQDVVAHCGCSHEKLAGVIQSLTPDERADAVENGKISIKCEFCSTMAEFDPKDFADA